MPNKSYDPTEPYVYQSGKRKGKYMEYLMFTDYAFLKWHLQTIEKEQKGHQKNELHLHLEWLLHQGENRHPRMICPHCRKRTVQYFSLIQSSFDRSISVGTNFTCCDDPKCEAIIESYAFGHNYLLLPIKFSSITVAEHKQDQKKIGQLLHRIFCLPDRISPKELFSFFSDEEQMSLF